MSSPGVGGITSGGDKLQLDNFKPRFQIAAWLLALRRLQCVSVAISAASLGALQDIAREFFPHSFVRHFIRWRRRWACSCQFVPLAAYWNKACVPKICNPRN